MNETSLTKKFELLGKVFAIGSLAIYATGFLIMSAFLDRFGVGEAGTEFLKIKYVQVGLLFALFPCGVIAPIFLFFYLKYHPKRRVDSPSIGILSISNLFFVFYWFATFANPEDFAERRGDVGVLLAYTIFFFVVIRRLALKDTSHYEFVDFLIGKFCDPWINWICSRIYRRGWFNASADVIRKHSVRVVLFGLFPVFDYFAVGYVSVFLWGIIVVGLLTKALGRWCLKEESKQLKGKPNFLKKMFFFLLIETIILIPIILVFKHISDSNNVQWAPVRRAFFYYFYCSLAAICLGRDMRRIPERNDPEAQPAAWLAGACVIVGLYYMAILGFAHSVYPHIPASRGGGNYVKASNVELYWESEMMQALPTNIISSDSFQNSSSNKLVKSIPLKIIEETPSTVFVADPNGPKAKTNDMAAGNGVESWSSWNIPEVIALRKDSITAIVHCPSTSNNITFSK